MPTDLLSLKATDKVTFTTNTDVKIAIDHHDHWRAVVPTGKHILALYANIDLPPSASEPRLAIARGGWRAWFQQWDAHEEDRRDETGYLGPIAVPTHGNAHLLISHSWPHTVDTDPWEFLIRVYAYDTRGREVSIPLTMTTREAKVQGA
jgi:hypothetical protein